eukprot:2479335-Pleurochrysis_carterae.AAC.1
MNRATGTAAPSAAASMPVARTSLPVGTARAGGGDRCDGALVAGAALPLVGLGREACRLAGR